MKILKLLCFTIIAQILMESCSRGPSEKSIELMKSANSMFGLLPFEKSEIREDSPLEVLGRKLYFDTRLSVNESISCNTCHNITDKAGVDNLISSSGFSGIKEQRNTPTVYNASLHSLQSWDGRHKTPEEQIKSHLLDPKEMGFPDEKSLESKLSLDLEYKILFTKAFPNHSSIQFENIVYSIVAFQKKLITYDRFDEYQRGNYSAFSAEEEEGLRVFMSTGCTMCHRGPLLGGNLLMKLGIVNEYENKADIGKESFTGSEGDRFIFKVPSLRNVALTYPYYHDGRVETLEEAVSKMGYLQLGKNLSKEEIVSIVTFLKTLSDRDLEKRTSK